MRSKTCECCWCGLTVARPDPEGGWPLLPEGWRYDEDECGHLCKPCKEAKDSARERAREERASASASRSTIYKLGWNDRVAKTTEEYGKAYLSNGGVYVANDSVARAWTTEDRAEYVRGWQDASARIAALAIP